VNLAGPPGTEGAGWLVTIPGRSTGSLAGMTTGSVPDRGRRPGGLGWLAWGLCAAAEVTAAACVVLLLAGRVGLGEAVDAYLVTNLGMVVAFGAIGGLVAGNRPGNPIGWLFLGHSLCFAVATLAGTVAVARQDVLSQGSLRALLIVFMGVWPLGIGIALPLAVQLFPTGRPLGPGWRWLVGLTVVSGLAFDAQTVLDPSALALTSRPVPPLISPTAFHAIDPLWAVAGLLLVTVLAASVAELMVRFRRARGVERLQLTWLVWAVVLFAVLNSPRWITGSGPILFLLTLPLVPAAPRWPSSATTCTTSGSSSTGPWSTGC
jgi:two-component system NarL family sensor kinase